MKNLIAYAVAGSIEYLECVLLSIKSVKHATTDEIDFLILCDNNIFEQSRTHQIPNVTYWCVSDVPNTPYACFLYRFRIFDAYPRLHEYDMMMYLDADILVYLDVNALFASTKRLFPSFKGIHVNKDRDKDEHHHCIWYSSFGAYVPSDIEYFEKHQIYPFCSGTWITKVSKEMCQHMMNVYETLITKPLILTDQPYVNEYFNTRNLTNQHIFLDNYIVFPSMNEHCEYQFDKTDKIVHFTGAPGTGNRKLDVMRKAWAINTVAINTVAINTVAII